MVDFVQLQEIVKGQLARDRTVQSIEAVGTTLEAAVSDAAALLDVPVRRLEYEILERGSSGFWGMGKKDWRIQAYERIATLRKKHGEGFFGEEDEFDIPVIEDRDGEAFVCLREGGDVLLKVTSASGKGRKASETYVMHLLKGRKVEDIDADAVAKTLSEALGVYIKVGTFEHRSYNDSVARVEISESEMLGYIIVTKPGDGGCDIAYDTYINTLKNSGVVYGIKEKFLRDFVDQPVYSEKVEIAEGSKPIDGKNAYIHYNFETDQSRARLKEGYNGRVDFKDLNIIQNVTKGEPLAKKMPPEKGVSGETVTGKMFPARDGVEIPLPLGENVHVAEDGETIVASKNGRVVFSNGLISIEEVYLVEDDVNLKTGNITFNGSVIIKGNVDDGFFVKATGNIEVQGTVAKANLVSDGDVIIRQGINGKGEGRIQAGKSVWSRFIQNANIIAGNMVVASDGIINSQVSALNRIICQGKRAAIMGGRLRACEEINAKVLGNPTSGTETICEVGFDPRSKEELDRLQMEKENITKLLEDFKLNIQTLTNIKQQRKVLPDDKEAYLQDLIKKREILTAELKKNEGEIQKIQDYLGRLKARSRVSASTKVYPGVRIVIRDARNDVLQEYRAVTFILENGLVRAIKYEEPDESVTRGPDGYTTN